MSWGFEYNGKDKTKLKAACRMALMQSVRGYGDNAVAEKMVEPVAAAIDNAIDIAKCSDAADYMCLKSSGHIDKDQCYFSIEVRPVYLPKLVDE